MQVPRLYVNGFPKSGLHLAERMVYRMFKPVTDFNNWWGTNAWETEAHGMDGDYRWASKLASIRPGQYMKGHSGYKEKLHSALADLNVSMVFIYRDLRDVVVSQAHHIAKAGPSGSGADLWHPEPELYEGDFEHVMKLVIEGVGPYQGIFDRWDTFAPWMEQDWVFPITFRELVRKPQRAASRFFDYAVGMAAQGDVELPKEIKTQVCDDLVHALTTRVSTTFRKGKTGTWKEDFTPEITELFKARDTNHVMVKLGFEKDDNWQ